MGSTFFWDEPAEVLFFSPKLLFIKNNSSILRGLGFYQFLICYVEIRFSFLVLIDYAPIFICETFFLIGDNSKCSVRSLLWLSDSMAFSLSLSYPFSLSHSDSNTIPITNSLSNSNSKSNSKSNSNPNSN